MAFNAQPRLSNGMLTLRPLAEADFEGLYLAASSPETWAGHPKHDRWQRTIFEPYFAFLLETGTTLVALDTSTGGTHEAKIIGCSRYYPAPDIKESMSIGFTFLDHLYWGGARNRAMKALMLEHAFETFDEVWLHIAPTNIRSQKAAQKIGADYAYTADLAVTGAVTETLCYRISKTGRQQLVLNSSQQG
ncbi:GNAT family N-acetyltransferase [Gammaproteobacteria bacterium]|nr:GNAT family N-acetyltransferase [Gammaproteobacteria bacterium]